MSHPLRVRRAQVLAAAAALLLLARGVAAAAETKPLLISGYDDVIRQANNTSVWAAAKRLNANDETYAGMPELYRALAGDAGAESFFVVSATSTRFEERAATFLGARGFPPSRLFFRRWLTQWSALNFKVATIESLLDRQPRRTAIIVLDNSDTSVTLARDLRRAHNDRIAAIYLRQTLQGDTPDSTYSFVTAFDIAVLELDAGRMSEQQALQIADEVVRPTDAHLVIPEYSYCPRDYDPCAARSGALAGACARVRQKVIGICAARAAR